MRTIRELNQDISFTRSLKSLISSKEELSVLKIQKIRGSVIQTREFTAQLSTVVEDIRSSYKEAIHELMTEGSLQDLINMSIAVKRGAWVSVLITPNTRLAGTIVPKIYALFLDSVRNSFSDVVIIGQLGKELYEQSKINHPYKYFEVPEADLDLEALKEVIGFIFGYARIDLYYGKLYSLVNQEAVKTDITADKIFFDMSSAATEAPGTQGQALQGQEEKRQFLFEPEVKEILSVMELQFLALFFKQIIHESNLAQLGSRINFMEESSNKIEEAIKKLDYQEKMARRLNSQRKMQQTLAGISLWG